MKFIELREVYGGLITINLDKVERITEEPKERTRIWFSGDERDSVVVAREYGRVIGEIGCVSI